MLAAATTETVSVASGPIKATLHYHVEQGSLPDRHLDRIDVFWHGRQAFSGPLPENFTDAYASTDPSIIEAVDLDLNGTPEIVVHTYTGGAHCCVGSVIYGYDPNTKRIAQLAHDWQNGGYNLRTIRGHRILVSDDQRFAYAFASYARSGFPIQIWAYAPVALHDVTRCYPDLIRRDAQFWWSVAEGEKRETRPETLGLLAAYSADEFKLGRSPQALRAISGFDSQVTPSYLRSLQLFLRENGYESHKRPACT
jgi:hypothetical protein